MVAFTIAAVLAFGVVGLTRPVRSASPAGGLVGLYVLLGLAVVPWGATLFRSFLAVPGQENLGFAGLVVFPLWGVALGLLSWRPRVAVFAAAGVLTGGPAACAVLAVWVLVTGGQGAVGAMAGAGSLFMLVGLALPAVRHGAIWMLLLLFTVGPLWELLVQVTQQVAWRVPFEARFVGRLLAVFAVAWAGDAWLRGRRGRALAAVGVSVALNVAVSFHVTQGGQQHLMDHPVGAPLWGSGCAYDAQLGPLGVLSAKGRTLWWPTEFLDPPGPRAHAASLLGGTRCGPR